MALKRQDYLVVLAALLIPVLIASLVFIFPEIALPLTFWTGKWVQVPVVLAGLAVVYLAQRSWTGEIGRSLTVTAIGFFVVLLIWTPHDVWHLSLPPMPAWFQVSRGSWTGIYHGLTVTMTLVVAYGYYLFWRLGRE